MIKEAYCSYEVCKLLKEKGFDEPCLQMWECGLDKRYLFRLQSSCYQNITEEDSCLAPTHQMAMAWLREKNIHVDIYYLPIHRKYMWAVVESKDPNSKGSKETYEEAVEAALNYSLENLI